jgi:putative peptide zinc metalloprotease protein
MASPFFSQHWYRVSALKPRLRPHHRLNAHQYEGETWYVLRDEATNRVHRFSTVAFSIIGALDGERTVETIWLEAAATLGERAPSQDDVIRLLAHLHQQDMLQTGLPPDARDLLERLNRQRRAIRAKTWKNPLAIGIPLFDPDRLLGSLQHALAWVPGRLLAALWLAAVLPAAGLALIHGDAIAADVATDLLALHNVVLLAGIYLVTKIVHELAHGIAAKSFGASVNEFGVMLLVLYPTPYVDVSSAQAIDDKWQRALVSGAGIAADLLLASLALYVWLAAEPGFVRAVALNTVLICGLSSLFVNGNPLMRFDGYFVMCDLFDKPNLAPRANRFLATLIERNVFDVRGPSSDAVSRAEARWYVVYAPVSYLYRMVLLAGIGLFVATEYLFIGVLVVLWTLWQSVLFPIGKIVRHLIAHPRLGERRPVALGVTGAVIAGVGSFAALLPLPHHSMGEGVVWLPDEAEVRAAAPGFVRTLLAQPGATVAVGDPLMALDDPLLATRLTIVDRRLDEATARMNTERFTDLSRFELARRDHQALAEERALLAKRQDQLVIRARVAGMFEVPRHEGLAGRFFREGDLVGHVTAPPSGLLRIVVPQKDIDLVRHALRRVEVRRADRPADTITAAVVREVPGALNQLPSAVLSTVGGGAIVSDPQDPTRTLERLFQFDLALDTPISDSRFGTRVHVKFHFTWEPMLAQVGRTVRRVFLSKFDV